MGEKLTLSAVAGDRLYLTSLLPPILGKLLSVDLTKDVDPEVRVCRLVILCVTNHLKHGGSRLEMYSTFQLNPMRVLHPVLLDPGLPGSEEHADQSSHAHE